MRMSVSEGIIAAVVLIGVFACGFFAGQRTTCISVPLLGTNCHINTR